MSPGRAEHVLLAVGLAFFAVDCALGGGLVLAAVYGAISATLALSAILLPRKYGRRSARCP